MSKFKAGQRIRALETDPENSITEGKEYTVMRVWPCVLDEEAIVYFEDDSGGDGGVYAFRFELVEPQYTITGRYPNGGLGVTAYFDSEQEARDYVQEYGASTFSYELRAVPAPTILRVTERTVREVSEVPHCP